ncbi:putative transferase [Helianthus annuus]|nr:putative transferase [Helianthus annuus]
MEKSPEFSNRNSDDVSDSYLRNLLDIIDVDLRNEIFPKSLKAYFGIAQRCLQKIPKQRPNMLEVVRCLESALAASQERITLQSTGSVNEVSFRDLNQATRGFSRDLLVSEGGGRRDFNAKIGGFGWSKIRDKMRQKGAFGYLKADYDISTGDLLTKNDICSFGFVMLETLTGRHLNLDVLEGLESLELRAPKSKSNRRKLKKMMDPRLKDIYSIDGAFKCMALALRCITIRPEYRPSREEIVWSLEQIVALNKYNPNTSLQGKRLCGVWNK